MKAAVIGLGVFGQTLAVTLARAGIEVIAIDSKSDAVDDVKDDVALAVALDSTDEKALRAQGIQEVDVLVSCIGENFEANQLTVILAKKIGVRHVICRASTQTHARILKLIGADFVFTPEVAAAESLARHILKSGGEAKK
jgi:trk system potassium uptake protein TrkA